MGPTTDKAQKLVCIEYALLKAGGSFARMNTFISALKLVYSCVKQYRIYLTLYQMDYSIFEKDYVHCCKKGMSVNNQNRLANSVDPDYEPSHQNLHCLHSYLVWSTGLKE